MQKNGCFFQHSTEAARDLRREQDPHRALPKGELGTDYTIFFAMRILSQYWCSARIIELCHVGTEFHPVDAIVYCRPNSIMATAR